MDTEVARAVFAVAPDNETHLLVEIALSHLDKMPLVHIW